MRAWLVLGVLTLLLALTPHPVSADAGLPKGCFCLRHVATDQVLHGCTGFKPPGSFFGHARCTNEIGEESTVLLTETWAVLAEGAPECNPCQVGDRPTREVPREEGDSQQEDGEPNGDSR
jgi:hypothetical protein